MEFRRVAMREARAHLADLLDDAEQGNVTFVTRHGRAVAAIAPAALLEQFGHALGALPPTTDSAADLAWRTEDGSTIVAQVKVYNSRPDLAEDTGKEGRTASWPAGTGGVTVVWHASGSGKTAAMMKIIEQYLRAGQPVVFLNPSGEYMRSGAGADTEGEPESDEDPRLTPSEAKTE